jgi:hypothetical protein
MLNLALCDPFTINVETTLNAEHAITFKKLHTTLFHWIKHEGGLTFTNIRTGDQVPRKVVAVQSLSTSDKRLPMEADKDDWVTLYPGHAHILQATFAPETEMSEKKWFDVGGFEDGETYEIGVCKGAAVDEWAPGSLDSILEIQKAGKSELELCTEIIPFEIVQSARFVVKRPDKHANLTDHPFHINAGAIPRVA